MECHIHLSMSPSEYIYLSMSPSIPHLSSSQQPRRALGWMRQDSAANSPSMYLFTPCTYIYTYSTCAANTTSTQTLGWMRQDSRGEPSIHLSVEIHWQTELPVHISIDRLHRYPYRAFKLRTLLVHLGVDEARQRRELGAELLHGARLRAGVVEVPLHRHRRPQPLPQHHLPAPPRPAAGRRSPACHAAGGGGEGAWSRRAGLRVAVTGNTGPR